MTIAPAPRQVDRQTFEALMKLLAEHPELNVEQLRGLVQQGGTRTWRSRSAGKIRPRNAGVLVAAC